jgi:hypothetical protein
MNESKHLLKVFLCHASQDKAIVRELYQRLKAEGWIDIWLDEKKLLPGQDWRLNIEEAVETSDIVVICLSSNSVSKEGFIQKELRYAREISLEKIEGSIFLIPLRINECDVPRGLRFYQWADYFGDKKDETYNALLESLRLRYVQKFKIEKEEYSHKIASPSFNKADKDSVEVEKKSWITIKRLDVSPQKEIRTADKLITIGRGTKNIIQINASEISWEQGQIILVNSEYQYFHLSKSTPSIIRRKGEEHLLKAGLQEKITLKNQDRILIGNSTLIVEFDIINEDSDYVTTAKQ